MGLCCGIAAAAGGVGLPTQLSAGADVSVRDKTGKTAADLYRLACELDDTPEDPALAALLSGRAKPATA
jgi:hypothetical protein